MATKQTNKKAPAKKPAGGARKKPQQAAQRTAAKRPMRREIGSAVCFFLAVFLVLGLSGVNAIFIDFFVGLVGGMIGYGCYALTFSLLACCLVLAFHRGRPVRLRITSAIGLAYVLGAIIHLFSNTAEYAGGFETIKQLYASGKTFASGGVLGGLTAIGAEFVFSRIGAGILLIVGGLILVFVTLSLTPVAIYRYIFNRERPEYELQEDPEPAPREVTPKNGVKNDKRRPVIDIPFDDKPVKEEKKPAPEPEEKPLLPKRPEHIRTPDEVMGGVPAKPEEKKKEPEQFTISGILHREETPKQEAKQATRPPEPTAQPTPPPQTEEQKKQDEAIKKEISDKLTQAAESQEQAAYLYPPVDLLDEAKRSSTSGIEDELKTNAQRLTDTIKSFGIEARIINVTRGPSVTRYELELDRGVKLTRLTGLSDDIALSLGASSVRIAPIPDKVAVVGIEVPNKIVTTVYMRELIESKEFTASKSRVTFAIGKDIGGEAVCGDIARLPHMLIAGTTGSGKSVCMNSLIISLLYKSTPDEVRFIMIDPKMIELNIYNGIPHLLIPVVTDPKKASGALQWAVMEMMRRYKLFAETNVRDIAAYNELANMEGDTEKLPQIVIVIDELADLMLVAAKEVEESVCRIAQMARAAGMHLVIATQRPSADVITGIMKANIPSRIAFAVASQLESRIILDTTGAEKLVGKGDMLFFPLGSGKPKRIQGCFITSGEVEKVVDFVKKGGKTDYSSEVMEQIERAAISGDKPGAIGGSGNDDGSGNDELLPQAVEVILETGQASVSMLQRRLKLGYARAARLVDQMETAGIVGPFEGAKPRQLLITREQWEEMKLQNPSYQ